jgi:hypothetical protein
LSPAAKNSRGEKSEKSSVAATCAKNSCTAALSLRWLKIG